MNNITDKHTSCPVPITPDIEKRVIRAINKAGREPRWFNIDAACNWLARHDDASADTAIKLYDYTVPRTIVQEWENGAIEAITECWREWNGRIWCVIFDEWELPSGEDGSIVFEVDAPGSRELPRRKSKKGRYLSDCCYYEEGDEEPTLAQLGL